MSIQQEHVGQETDNNIKEVIKSLRTRATAASRKANMFLLVMLLFVTAVFYFFYMQQLQSENELFLAILEFSQKVSNSTSSAGATLEKLQQSLEQQTKEIEFNKDLYEEGKVNKLNRSINDFSISIQHLSQQFDKITNVVIELPTSINKSKTNVLDLSSISIKMAVIIVLIFIAQTLINLYRYHTKVAIFYDGRADGLLLIKDISDINYEKLIALISPESFDFDSPKSPTEPLMDLVKTYYQNKSSENIAIPKNIEPNTKEETVETTNDNANK